MKKKRSPGVTKKQPLSNNSVGSAPGGGGSGDGCGGSGSSGTSGATPRQSTPPQSAGSGGVGGGGHQPVSGQQSVKATSGHPLPPSGGGGTHSEEASCNEDSSALSHHEQSHSSRDDLDALLPTSSAGNRTKLAIEHLQSKISRTKEAIKAEQTARDENVNEYLKLAANADRNQVQRIKSVFEKKNQKSAQVIAQLQKKLESYSKRIKDLETYGWQATHHHRPKEMLKDVGQGLKDVGTNIREGISGISGGVIGSIKYGISATHYAGEKVITKPRHFFRSRFGSADNIPTVEKSIPEDGNTSAAKAGDTEATVKSGNPQQQQQQPQQHHQHQHHQHSHHQRGSSLTHTHTQAHSQSHSHSTKYTSDDESSSMTSGSGHIGAITAGSPGGGDKPVGVASLGSSTSPTKQQFRPYGSHLLMSHINSGSNGTFDIEPLLSELRDRRDECQRLTEEFEAMKTTFQAECTLLHQNLQDERYRFERLEEQMNDLIELHQNEIENLKQGIGDMEEKVQYQSEERLRDIHDMLESCQTRISRMEHQQHQHLQQLVNLDSLENSNARALFLKLINILLTILQVVLLLVATVANILTPFLQTRIRILTTILLLVILIVFTRQWPEICNYIRLRLGDRFPQVLFLFPESPAAIDNR